MKLCIELSQASVQAAAKALLAYANDIERKADEVCRRLCEIGVDAAVSAVRLDTGELASTIRFEQVGDSEYLVLTDGEYAAFVEFGTGVIGSGTYPGELPADWNYDERRTPAAHDRDDPTKWYYYDRFGVTASTRGQTANAFMAHAAEEMRLSILDVAKEVFRT